MSSGNSLGSIGFSPLEIQIFNQLQSSGCRFTPKELQCLGYTPEQIKRLRYMYSISIGKVSVNSKEQYVRHLRKLNNHSYKITMQDLGESRINSVPRLAVVANIKQEPYNIWNSNKYSGMSALYRVLDTKCSKIVIETSRKPVLKYGSAKVIPGVLEIKGVKQDGNAVIEMNTNYCRLCNRYVIVGSIRRPEFHLGMYEIICFEGTTIYVFIKNIGVKENIRYSPNSQRVYDYGIMPQEAKPKLERVAKALYKKLGGNKANYVSPNEQFILVSKPKERVEANLV